MLNLRHPTTLLLAALGLGLCADWLFHDRAPGISLPLFVAALLVALAALGRAEGRAPTPANRWVGPAALFFAVWVGVRDSPTLVACNILAVLGLLLLAIAVHRAEALHQLSGWRILAGMAVASFESALLPVPLALRAAAQLPASGRQARGLLVVGRGLALAAPALLVFTALLAMADSVFASYVIDLFSLRLPFDMAELTAHAVVSGIVAWAVAGGLVVALREVPRGALLGVPELPAEGDTQRLRPGLAWRRPLGCGEAVTALLAVDALFGAFMLIQGTYLFGGREALERAGMTYADYARRGFFELVAVACLALAMLWAFAALTRRDDGGQRRAFNAACAAMVGLVLGMLASAFLRMWLYEQAYGFTELRLYTHVFMVWLGAALLLFLGGLLRERPRLFSLGAPVAAALVLAALNMANPDAIIVGQNIARYQASGDLDSYYLGQLSADAVPALAAALPVLGPEQQAELRAEIALMGQQSAQTLERDGWPAWSIARARALAAARP